jgi:hypothetical protein
MLSVIMLIVVMLSVMAPFVESTIICFDKDQTVSAWKAIENIWKTKFKNDLSLKKMEKKLITISIFFQNSSCLDNHKKRDNVK